MTIHEKVTLAHKLADGYTIPLGPFNLVVVATDKGTLCCGAFDVIAMDKERFTETKNVIGGIAYPANKYGKTIYEAG